jgi:SH3-like domain-containing protein
MTRFLRLILALLLVISSVPLARGAQSETSDVQYGRITRPGAHLRNIPDGQGRVLAEPAEGAVVRLHGGNGGWSKAEVPNGFPVWVHRRYVEETSESGVVEIKGNGVNVRALPSSGVNNFPVGQLYAGDQVRVLETPAELADEAREWVHITSPEGFWAWIRSGEIAPLAEADGVALWNEARGKLVRARETAKAPATTAPVAPSDPRVEAAQAVAVREALELANKALEREREAEKPDFAAVRRAYEAVMMLEPGASVGRIVAQKLDNVALLESTASLRAELQAERQRNLQERTQLERAISEDARRKDPLGDVFDERGLLERRTIAERTRYFLRWGGRDVCEVVCTTGRYEVNLFLGLDVGVRGEVLPLPTGTGAGPVVPIVDLHRIEVLAAN